MLAIIDKQIQTGQMIDTIVDQENLRHQEKLVALRKIVTPLLSADADLADITWEQSLAFQTLNALETLNISETHENRILDAIDRLYRSVPDAKVWSKHAEKEALLLHVSGFSFVDRLGFIFEESVGEKQFVTGETYYMWFTRLEETDDFESPYEKWQNGTDEDSLWLLNAKLQAPDGQTFRDQRRYTLGEQFQIACLQFSTQTPGRHQLHIELTDAEVEDYRNALLLYEFDAIEPATLP